MTIQAATSAPHAASTLWTGRGAVAGATALIAFAVTAFAPQVLNDGDSFLHIAAGSRMLADHAILTRDPFSYTFAGAPWQAHEWLAEVLMAGAFKAGGWGGVLTMFATAAAATAFVLSYTVGRFLAPKAQVLATLIALACMTGSLLARPHLLALPLLALWTAELTAARAEKRLPSLWLLPLMCIWVNIHGSFLLGLALAAGLALEALIETRRTFKGWSLFGLGALGAALINPHFAYGVIFPFTLMATPALAAVGEWQPTPLTLFQPIVPAAAFSIYVLIRQRADISLMRTCLVIALFGMAFLHARHQIVAAVAVPLLLAEPLSGAMRREAGDTRLAPALIAALALLVGVRWALPVSRDDSGVAPLSALAHVPPALRTAPVLNDYSFGGYLIFAGVKPFIDSRAELYGEAALETYAALVRPDRAVLESTLRRYAIRWSIMNPASPIVAEIDAMPGWRRLYADRFAVVQIRDSTTR